MSVIPQRLEAALSAPSRASEVCPGIWGAGGAAPDAQYDSIGGAYHLIGGMDLYHRAFWGVATREYRRFAHRAVECGAGGNVLDAGCGSMLFSADSHRRAGQTAIIGADASLKMLQMARERLGGNAQPNHLILFHTDVVCSGFRTTVFSSVLCLHVAHVLEDLDGLVQELHRVLRPGGRLFLTSVALVNSWRDRYLRALAARGILASPRRQQEVLDAVQRVFQRKPEHHRMGSMLFVEACKAQI